MWKVLIVEDLEAMRKLLQRIPVWGDESGFEIAAEASDGYSAIELIRQQKIDLVITDIRMPKMNGLELLKKVNQEKDPPCIVLLSNYSEFSYAREAVASGAFDYLVKPVSAEDLLAVLGRVRHKLEEQYRKLEHVKALEARLDEKIEAFFPSVEAAHIVEQILNGNLDSVRLAETIFEFAAVSLNHDLIKIEHMLKSVLLQVAKSIQEHRPWITRFIDKTEMETLSFMDCLLADQMRDHFIKKINDISVLIYKLECGRPESEIVSRMCSCVLEGEDDEISLKSVADKLFMNRNYLSEIFRRKTGIQFVEYMTSIKVERAKMLLMNGRLKTYEIAEMLSFKDIEYFSRLFKKHTGLAPAEYRQSRAG